MGFESNFGKQRKVLAETLKESRSKGSLGRQQAREILSQAQETESYTDNKILHTVSRFLGEEYRQEASVGIEDFQIPSGWKEEDISSQIPEKYRRLLDVTVLAQAADFEIEAKSRGTEESLRLHDDVREHLFKLRFGRPYNDLHTYDDAGGHVFNQDVSDELDASIEKETQEAQEFWDTLTEGRFLDPHNLNHFIQAETSNEFSGPFNPHSLVQPGAHFWASAHGSSYTPLYGSQLIILSPRNQKFRQFLEKVAYPNSESLAKNTQALFEAFMRGEGLPLFGDRGSIENWFSAGIRQEQRTKQDGSVPYSWLDIADCIVDLRSGKRWTKEYSKDELIEVQKDMDAYRSGVKELAVKSSPA